MEAGDVKGVRNIKDMTINPLPNAKKVLVLAPHPDDESLGCGGIIALYSSKGVEVHLAVISSGENIVIEFTGDKDISDVRRQELEDSSLILGIKEIRFLGFPDGQLALHKDRIEEKLREIINEINPDIIFAPSPLDHHDDHRAVADIAISFLAERCVFKVAFYEVYETIRFNTLIDISDVVTVKEQAIKNYHYSLMRQPELYNEAIKGLNRFRSFHARQVGYYEAFWIVSNPLTHAEVYTWLTYGMDNAEIRFLSSLKAVDTLLFELNKSYDLLSSKESELKSKEAEIMEMDKTRLQLAELNSRLQDMQKSLIWKFAGKYYKVRDILLPEGGMLRNIYNRILLFIKGR